MSQVHIAFTICSNNYLAHAKTLGDSYLSHHPDHTFIIGLVDKVSSHLTIESYKNFVILPVDILQINNFQQLVAKYNITELCTSVKPRYFKYIFETYQAETVIYLDPDILVVSPLLELYSELKTHTICITPHMCSPIDDAFAPNDHHVLPGGVYNLGFIGLSNYKKVLPFLEWWDARVLKYGFRDYCKGMFYDQLWINYVPCFFDNYKIMKHLGYNMANWNFHERELTVDSNGDYIVNNSEPLRFFHFSGYKHHKKDEICGYQNRFNFTTRKDLKNIFYHYFDLLTQNDIEEISKLETFYHPRNKGANKKITSSQKKSFLQKILKRIKLTGRVLLHGN